MPRARKPTRGAAEDAKAILNRVRQLVRALRAFDKKAQARYGIGAAQMFILHILGDEAELSVNELAERTATDQSSASLAVGRLVDEGYVRRVPSEKDRRQVRLSLTPRGRSVVRRAPPAAQQKIMSSVVEMTARERKQLLFLLDKLMAGLDVGTGHTPMLFQDGADEESRPRRDRRVTRS